MNFLGRFFSKAAAPSTSSFFLAGLSSSLPQNIKAYAKEGYSENPIVFACASIIANAAASVKLEVYTTDAKGNKKVDTKHPLLDLMAKPNPMQTWEEFAIEMVAWHRVAGEFFILRLPETGKPKELYILNPDLMDVKGADSGNIPFRYEYGTGEKKSVYPVNRLTGESQILHIKTFNPNNQWRGLSPLSPAARATDIHNNGSKWNSNLLLNSARPSGVVEVAGTVDETTVNRLREYFKKAWEGPSNAGNVPLLTGGAKFTQLSHSPKDMDFEKNMAGAAKDIGLVYGVPLPLLTMEAATFSNMDAAQERLWTDTVLPLLNLIIKKLSQFLVPLFDSSKSGVTLAYNADSAPGLEPQRERLYKRMKDAVGGGLITPNEARAEMGFEEVEGGDVLLVPGTLKPIDQAEAQPTNDLVKAMKLAGFDAKEIIDALGATSIKEAA
ncbi:phage portal protein [Rhizobium leguminosarum]|uniref:phage portal protein n=1 Tax=Rhizobium ruizarguesonis TaxID=2081791 RepID=UPI0013BC3963|nr:phage portal protein [Rhizobium ruizarguesonis]NEJ15500.1 phage portal protein [Rhizobium ruizarguesonis]NEK29575.1 phage portal protein [Rhizobium ruizarguesonis]